MNASPVSRLYPLFLGWVAVLISSLFVEVCAADMAVASLTPIQHLPAGNPYREVLEKYLLMPEVDRVALLSWSEKKGEGEAPSPPLTAGQRELLAGLTGMVREAAGRPDAAVWPLVPDAKDPDNPLAITLPHIGSLIALGRIVTRGAGELPAPEAIDTCAAVAQMGRQARSGHTLIEQLTGAALEGITTAEVARRIGEFSGPELDRLSVAWAGLRPAPGIDRALAGERERFFKPFLDQILKPGLAALLAEQEALSGTGPSEGGGVGSELRLTALISDGQRMIGLENRISGASFFVAEGKTVNEVTLLSINFDRKRAMLRVRGKEAVMDLVSKRIVERREAVSRLSRVLKFMGSFSSEPMRETDALLDGLVRRARNHPAGLDGYIGELQSHYDAGLVDALQRAEQPRIDDSSMKSPPDDPVLIMLSPGFESIARRLTGSELTPVLLRTAVALRQEQLAGKPARPLADPWSKKGEALRIQRTSDGGFILSSIYEDRAGRPVEYKYAAPDAGQVRR